MLSLFHLHLLLKFYLVPPDFYMFLYVLAAYNIATKTYDFTPVFVNVAKHITKADIAISNLETTFAGADRGYTGYPRFNSPATLGEALKNIGIDIVSTANNHSLDKEYFFVCSIV